VLVGAGDIGQCGSAAVAATALLIDRISGIVFTTGDNVLERIRGQLRDCYEPHWGRHRARTRPTPGNHDYDTGGAAAYYTYSRTTPVRSASGITPTRPVRGGSSRSTRRFPWGQGRPSSNGCDRSCQPRGRGARWSTGTSRFSRRARTAPTATCARYGGCCTNPTPTSSSTGTITVQSASRSRIRTDVPIRPRIRQFTVGTGGGAPYTPVTSAANTEALGVAFGVLKLTLSDGGYQWEFIPIPGASFSDSGMGQCH
jgi:hypothetical protein